jgi:hypothetical protein
MQYLLSVHEVEDAAPRPAEEMRTIYRDVDAFNAVLKEQGSWVFAGGLHPANKATVVRHVRDGEVLMTDGPFAEGKEHIGGFWVIEAADSDAALAWAARASRACAAAVEVRPFHDVPED